MKDIGTDFNICCNTFVVVPYPSHKIEYPAHKIDVGLRTKQCALVVRPCSLVCDLCFCLLFMGISFSFFRAIATDVSLEKY